MGFFEIHSFDYYRTEISVGILSETEISEKRIIKLFFLCYQAIKFYCYFLLVASLLANHNLHMSEQLTFFLEG